ncbi:bleomycin resistance protein [Actinomadura madurae]|uniref:bleomycin resistance protein n=1 Tax=Actinomadura madurae TaxID=1993 RepID=UPI0020D258F7|nr:VOC family protein [Actinomadura madurae]MCP9952185.1 VOC family protein [Actinomadura madurae]MCP9968942.1 VOC family protein [Actinomadura madurae]MCP9981415.1 VOC family protein [Actinomadura madurae]MCQ0007074.1 VOC family protein [Actinomadura madurae]MCQ0017619.1 VOC family protein [Actinomadura madurae]
MSIGIGLARRDRSARLGEHAPAPRRADAAEREAYLIKLDYIAEAAYAPGMGEKAIPIYPCRSIEATWEFYRALGFEQITWQLRPNPYVAVRRGDIELQFFGWKKHEPAASMNMCYVTTTDVDALYEAFRGGLRQALGRIPTRGLPRLSAVRDMSYGVRQFLLSDPDGLQLRIGQPISDDQRHAPVPKEPVAKALHMAALLADSKGDHRAAAKILDHLLASDEPLTPAERLKALVLRADAAVQLEDWSRARALVAQARAVDLPDPSGLMDDLNRLTDLESASEQAGEPAE